MNDNGAAKRRAFVPPAMRWQRRVGAVLSIEWLILGPIFIALMFAITEFSLLWSANRSLESATFAACREATLIAIDEDARFAGAVAAAERTLGDAKYIEAYNIETYDPGVHTGDPVIVELNMPMEAAAPDLLAIIGISIEGKKLQARAVMRRE